MYSDRVDATGIIDKRSEHGPFDIVGDLHGCYQELRELLTLLGYCIDEDAGREVGRFRATPPPRRRLLFLGDLVDRGPRITDVVRLVMDLVEQGTAWCIGGNHEFQMLRHFDAGTPIAWGLAETLEQLRREPPELTARLLEFARDLPAYHLLDGGRLVVAHAGLPEHLHGAASREAQWFALYGTTTGTRRTNWAADYHGPARVVYGHTPATAAEWINDTICIDTGCVYGGSLTALRYPELEIVSVPAVRVHYRGA